MMCASCSKLAFLYTKKSCLRCKADVLVTIATICELCSTKDKVCSVCLKKIPTVTSKKGGCGCGKK